MTPGRPTTGGGAAPEPDGGDAPGTTRGDRMKAALTAVLLLVTGAALGVTVDRMWVAGPPEAGAAPLTVDAMARSLELGPDERDRVGRLLDSLQVELTEAARSGPDSLRVVARRSRARLERALPPHARPGFRRWMRDHHRRMMRQMHGGGMMGPMHEEGMGPMHRDGMGSMQMSPMHRSGGDTARRDGGGMMRSGGTSPRR